MGVQIEAKRGNSTINDINTRVFSSGSDEKTNRSGTVKSRREIRRGKNERTLKMSELCVLTPGRADLLIWTAMRTPPAPRTSMGKISMLMWLILFFHYLYNIDRDVLGVFGKRLFPEG